jgi:hypothetical protein
MSVARENTLPGVIVRINTGQVARPVERQPTSTFFAVGYCPWGPVNTPTTVTSWADFVRKFGGFDANSFLDDALYPFFNQFPGGNAVVCRVVGSSAAVGTLNLKDRSGGAGVNTLRADAKFPSTRVDVKIEIADGSTVNTFRLIATSAFLGSREVYDNLTLAAADLTVVNQRSQLVKLTNLNSATAAPNNIPRVLASAVLAGGSDDFAGIDDGDLVGIDSEGTRTGLQVFNDENLGTGQVAVPGYSTDAIHTALAAHAGRNYRLALLDTNVGMSYDEVSTVAVSSNAAIYWPWVECLAFDGSGVNRHYPPSGFVAGACARVDREIGTHKAPANIQIPGAINVETLLDGKPQVDDNVRALLNAKNINVIAPIGGAGVRIYGGRVLTPDARVQFVHEARMLNLCYHSAKKAYAWAVFAAVDGTGRLFRDLAATGRNFLRGLWRDGALYGKSEEEAFIVVADESNNPQEDLANGVVRVQWGVKLSPTAERIEIAVDNAPLFQDLTVLNS